MRARVCRGLKAGAALMVAGLSAMGQRTMGQQMQNQSRDADSLHFAVASVSRTISTNVFGNFQCTSDGFVATAIPLKVLIGTAYRVREYQLSGGPAWVNSDLYDVRAKVDESDNEAFKRGGRLVCSTMLQNLLADRFHLIVHHRTDLLPAYELVVARGGPKMPSAGNGADPNDARAMDGVIDANAWTMSSLARQLSGNVGLPVTDKTNLSGSYKVVLHWSPAGPNGHISSGADMAEDPNVVSLFSALQDQVGLQLKAANAPTDVIVVDHAERPSGN
jgi:uncharacterized protein (TIGR03435 family)